MLVSPGWLADWRRTPPLRGSAPAPSLRMPAEELLARRLELLGCRELHGIRLTDNRSVMVSLSPRGVLSIHRGYAMAPDRVLEAVVRFLARGTPRESRRAAEREILAFRAEARVAGPPRVRRAGDRLRPGDLGKIERLARLFREFNARDFEGRLPELPLRLSGRMRTRLGQLCLHQETGEPYEITLNRRHVERHGWEEAAHTLLHEMVHLWQHVNGHAADHGSLFRGKAAELGIAPGSRRAVGPSKRRTAAARTV